MNANFIIFDNETHINNITQLKEFSESNFNIEINNNLYEIKGSKLLLKEVFNDNKSIKISGEIYEINKKNHTKEKEKSFFKKLFF
jgi:rubrerythrin